MVVVKGVPKIILRGDDVNSVQTFTEATFVNVSFVQWVRPQQAGSFSLSYPGTVTKCIQWNDVDSIKAELENIPALSKSLPVVVTQYGTASGYDYKIEFLGVAPFMLATNYFTCPDETLIDIRVDPSMYNRIIFRAFVPAGFNADKLSYRTANPIVLPTSSDKILVLGSDTTWKCRLDVACSRNIGGPQRSEIHHGAH